MTKIQEWTPCPRPEVGDVLKWKEPLWAAPNKPRGKPDKIGEQEIIARLIKIQDVLELEVISVKKLSSGDTPLKVKESDAIKRKKTTIEQGSCHKLLD